MKVRGCKRCPALVMDVTSAATGNPAALNADPSIDGNVRIDEHGFYHVLSKDRLAAARQAGEALYLNHYVTCPKAHEFHRRHQAGQAASR